jgi:hypothetical protein
MTKAPGRVACDPDPAGLLIASQVGEIWERQNVAWEPWYMDPSDFEGKGTLIPMTDRDLGLLRSFGQSKHKHPFLGALAQWLEGKKMKLEQESFVA